MFFSTGGYRHGRGVTFLSRDKLEVSRGGRRRHTYNLPYF